MMDANVTEAITGVIVAIGGLLSAIITYVVVPWIRAKTTREQRELAYGIVLSAVGYAEQTGLIDDLNGEQKKERAKGWIERRFKKLGITFDDDEVEGWIEDALTHLGGALGELVVEDEYETGG